jgi:hypothetical protein
VAVRLKATVGQELYTPALPKNASSGGFSTKIDFVIYQHSYFILRINVEEGFLLLAEGSSFVGRVANHAEGGESYPTNF